MDYKCDKCERNLKDHDKKKVIMEAQHTKNCQMPL